MLIGIDVGGTNIDGVILDKGKIIKKVKNPVNKDDLYSTVISSFEELIEDIDREKIERINLSTTISTNAIVENKNDAVLMVLQSGPGINFQFENELDFVEYVDGYVDHRGIEVKPLNQNEVLKINNNKIYKDLDALGIVTKFSTRNPEGENEIANLLDNFSYVSMGHSLSGNLSFPRRVYTTYLNASITRVFSKFLLDVKDAIRNLDVDAPIYILKADGGTMSVKDGLEKPIESVLSGPAASFMGITGIDKSDKDSIYLDIGGTTTDIFFLIDGEPLFEPKGIEIDKKKTLVRAIFSHSIGLGGDSYVDYVDGEIKIGPQRKDKPLAIGGKYLTLTDAMKVLDLIDFGDKEKSIEGIRKISEKLKISEKKTAEKILEKAGEMIKSEVDLLLKEINSRPLFTVKEVLENRKVVPKEIKVIGGPAEVLSSYIEKAFEIPTNEVENYKIANAYGACIAKPTFQLNLLADTKQKMVVIPEMNIHERISRRFSMKDGEKMIIENLEKLADSINYKDYEIEIIEKNEFNMVDGFSFGKNIRLKAQIKPGLVESERRKN